MGCYRLLRGTARGALDPFHPGRRNIVNLEIAPRNREGLVEYAVDPEILCPASPRRGNGRIIYDVLKGGDKRVTTPRANGGPLTNSPRGACEQLLSELPLLEEDVPQIVEEAAAMETGLPEG